MTKLGEINKIFFNKKTQIDIYLNEFIRLNLLKPEEILFPKFIHKNSNVLDVGCGTGRTTIHISKMTDHVIGIDNAENMILAARQKFHTLDLRLMDVTKMDFPDNYFDVVIFSFNGICYIYPEASKTKALLEIKRVLKNDGVFIYSVLNKYAPYSMSSFINVIISLFFLGFSGKYKLHLTRTGLTLMYESELKEEIEIMHRMNFNYQEHIPSEAMVKAYSNNKPLYTYYVFSILA